MPSSPGTSGTSALGKRLPRTPEDKMRIPAIASLLVVGFLSAAQAQSSGSSGGSGGGATGGSGGTGGAASGPNGPSSSANSPGATSPGGSISPEVAPANPAPSTTGSRASPIGTTGSPQGTQGTPGAVSPSNPEAASRPQVPNISGAPIIINDPSLQPNCSSGSVGSRAGC